MIYNCYLGRMDIIYGNNMYVTIFYFFLFIALRTHNFPKVYSRISKSVNFSHKIFY